MLAGQALAGDLTINNSETEPVFTSDPNGDGTPGNILIDVNGSVVFNEAGPAVTIDSNNTVTINGNITNNAVNNAIGLHILGGFTGNLQDADHRPIGVIGTGTITLNGTGTGDEIPGTGNIGILLDGADPFTGDLDLHEMSMSVSGVGAVGIQVDTGLNGNLSLAGISMVGQGASALVTRAAITGTLSNTGNIVVIGASPFDSTIIDPLAGPALAIGSDVTGGFLNAGPVDIEDVETVAASISLVGSSPAVEISPTISGSTGSLTIGVLDDEDTPGFSFVNRGGIQVNGAEPGISSTAIYIGREAGDASGFTATLTGGMYNRSIINAIAVSDNGDATTVEPQSADATAIHIAAGGIVPIIKNDTGGFIGATTGGPKGGTAIAILLDPGATLTSIVNNGSIKALAQTSDPTMTDPLVAIAIWDKSGSLTSVTNSGTIQGVVSSLDNGTQLAMAADFSANTTTLTLTNSGTITGDILFGSGTNEFIIDGADDVDGNNLAVVSGSYRAAPGGVLDITLDNGTITTPSIVAHNLHVADQGVIALTLPDPGSSQHVIDLSGNGDFAAGSRITFGYSSFIGDAATFVLVHADGTLSVDDIAGTTDASKPYLYHTDISNNGHDLTVELTRKTSDDLGFTGNLKALYEPAVAATQAATLAGTDNALGVALMGLTDAASTAVAFQSLVPVINGAQRLYAISLTDQSFGPVGARQRALIGTPNQGTNLAFWGQEIWLANRRDGTPTEPGYADSGVGVAAGADYGSLSTGRYGVAFEHFNGDSVEGDPRITKTVNNWTIFSAYADWMDADTGLFFGTQASGGFGSFDSTRRIQVGPYTPTAKSHWTGWLASWGASVGDVIGDDTFALIPQADINALYMEESEYSEHGAGAANLHVSDRTTPSVRGFLGLVGRAQFEFGGGYIRPELHIGYSHEFSGHPTDANVYFVSAQNMHFKISGPAEPVSNFVGGGSLSFVYNNWSVGGDYDRTLGSDTTSEAGSLTVTGHF